MIHIHPMTEQDAAIFRDVRLRALSDTPLAFGSTYAKESIQTDQQWEQKAKKWTQPTQAATFLGFDGLVCCGIVACCKREEVPHQVGIFSMWVAPQARRRGLGFQLLAQVEKWAVENGGTELVLDVTEGNEPASRCYQQYGFEFTGQSGPYPNDPKLRELWMLKRCNLR